MAHTSEQKRTHQAAYRAALAALAAWDAEHGYRVEIDWTAPEDHPVLCTLSAKQIARIQRERAKSVVAELPTLLKLIKRPDRDAALPVLADLPVTPDLPEFDSVICDWLTITHPLRSHHPIVSGGMIMKINRDKSVEWSSECWETFECPSSETSLRIKCDGVTVRMTGNIGRFGEKDNLTGLSVCQCIEKWRAILMDYLPKVDWMIEFFGVDTHQLDADTGELVPSGTRITRCDLAANFYTDNYSALSQMLMTRRMGQLIPRSGKYGPIWGYDSKRSNWLRAKVYDKLCELSGRRTPAAGETTARFEVQLGSEILKRQELHKIEKWKKIDMEKIIYGTFSNQVFREQVTAENWLDIPPRIRQYAALWRDGISLRNQCKSDATFYRVRKQLLEYGLDCSQPCNVMTLVRRIETVKVIPLQARRVA